MEKIDLFAPPRRETAGSGKRRKEREPRAPRPPRDWQARPVPKVSAREAILACLARREHSQKELRDKLKRQGHESEAIEAALVAAVEAGYQSDERYAASMVRYRSGRVGERKMRMLLNQQRIAPEVLEEALKEAPAEVHRAVDTLQSRFGSKAPTPELRQKATRFLMGRGFGYDSINKAWKVVFEGRDIEDFITD